MEDRGETLRVHAEMKRVRQLEEPYWRDIAILLAPEDRDFDAHQQMRRDDTAIFDSTPLQALDDFEGGFFSQATNPANRWFDLRTPDDELNAWQPVRAWFWRRTNDLLSSFSTSVSSFYSEAPSWFGSIGKYGLGTVWQEEQVGAGRIIDRAMPIGEIYIATDAEGIINRVHREFPLTGAQAKRKFRADWAGCQDERSYVFIQAVYPNEDYVPGRLGPRGMAFCGVYLSPDLADVWYPKGYYELPAHPTRWKRRSGRPYPVGPGHLARADIAMLNDMERSHIVAGQFAAEPPILAHSESELTAADVEPNAVLYGTMNAENGKKVIDTLQRSQNLQLSMAQSEQRRNAIRSAFRYGIMQLIQRPQMTATEFLGFQEETLKLMAPNLVRVQHEGLAPLIARRYRILERAGQFDHDPPPPELQNQRIDVQYNSPLARLLKVAEAKGTMQWLAALGEYAKMKGDPGVFDVVADDRVAIVLHDGYVADPTLLRDPKEVEAIRSNRAAMQQMQMQVEAAQGMAAAHADMSHAEQARTLAKGRMQ